MRLIIICLCLCSGVSLIAFSRAGFPEDPLRILGSPRPATDREAKDQARFARLRHSPAVETIGGPAMQDDVTRSALAEEPAGPAAPAPELPAALPAPVPETTNTVQPARKAEPASEHHPATVRARLRLARVPGMAMKRRVLFVRAAAIQRPANTPGVRRVLWTSATPPKEPGSLTGIP
ncbi:MAG: hypothetical protein ACLPKB_32330 [Xanthobacteraceae bacterium]